MSSIEHKKSSHKSSHKGKHKHKHSHRKIKVDEFSLTPLDCFEQPPDLTDWYEVRRERALWLYGGDIEASRDYIKSLYRGQVYIIYSSYQLLEETYYYLPIVKCIIMMNLDFRDWGSNDADVLVNQNNRRSLGKGYLPKDTPRVIITEYNPRDCSWLEYAQTKPFIVESQIIDPTKVKSDESSVYI